MEIIKKDNGTLITDVSSFNLDRTIFCGQAFRFEKSNKGIIGVVENKVLRAQQDENGIFFENITPTEFEDFWKIYFDFDRDYDNFHKEICTDERLKTAADFAIGIHILRQNFWEALCSFIFSQNNNIPRIQGIIKRFCENFGEKLEEGFYSFPSPEIISTLEKEDLSLLKCGFRDSYVLDAAKKVASGEISKEKLDYMDIDCARKALQTIKGVGPKVAECALLYGCGRIEAFPCDVWIKRIMAALLPEGLPENILPFAGIAQQYLYHYGRINKIM